MIKPTNEQKEILDSVLENETSVINAFAGTGKTSTLQMITKKYSDRKFLYLAYNKSIEMEAKKKFGKNVKVMTTHALAFKYVAKYTNISLSKIANLKVKAIADKYHINYIVASKVNKAFSNYCNSDSRDINESRDIKRVVEHIIDDIENGEILTTFDYVLKKMQFLLLDNILPLNEDVVLLDEAQDTNDVTLSIFNSIKAMNRVVVGDKHQQIYSFRGSKNALSKIQGKQYYLTESFRFNSKIAEYANQLLYKFKNEEKKLISKKNNYENFNDAFKKSLYSVGYISRNNTTLVGKILELIKSDYKFVTVREPNEIFRIILDVGYVCEKKHDKISYQNKYLHSIKDKDELNKYIIDSDDAELVTAMRIYEKNNLKTLEEALQISRNYFDNNKNERIVLTTAHTAKGLEWDCVVLEEDFKDILYLIAKFAYESKIANVKNSNFDFVKFYKKNMELMDDGSLNEINLLYVALTRAKKSIKINTKNYDYLFMSKAKLNENIYKNYMNIVKAKERRKIES